MTSDPASTRRAGSSPAPETGGGDDGGSGGPSPDPGGDGGAHRGLITFLGVFQAGVMLAGMVRWKVVALLLGPDGVGIAGVIEQLAELLVQVGSLSIPPLALKFLSLVRSEHDRGYWSLYRTLFRGLLLAAGAAAAIAAGVIVLRPNIVGESLGAHWVALALGLAAVPVMASKRFLKNVLATQGRYREAAVIVFGGSLLVVGATWIGIETADLPGMYAGMLLAGLAVAGVLHWSTHRKSDREDGDGDAFGLRELTDRHPDIVRFCVTMYVASAASTAVYAFVRYFVLELEGARAAGFLAAAYAIGMAVRVVLGEANNQYLFPTVSRSTPKEARAAEASAYLRSLAVLVFLLAVPAMLFPREILIVLYSSEFTQAAAFLALFVMAEVVLVFADVQRSLLLGFDDPVGYFTRILSSHALVIAAAAALVPGLGIVGAGIGHVAGAILVLALFTLRLRRRHVTPWTPRSVAVTLSTLLALPVLGVLGWAFPRPDPVTWAWKLLLAAAGLAVVQLTLPPDERGLRLGLLAPGKDRSEP